MPVDIARNEHSSIADDDCLGGDAIARWRAERDQTRLAIFDQKDREFAQLLFVHRGKGMGFTFLNRRLIPLLRWKAGVGE